MEKVKLSNGLEIPKIGYGSAIVLTYMYGSTGKAGIAKYWVRNWLKNRSQYRKDKALKNVVNVAMKNGTTLIDTSRAYAGSEYILGKTLKNYPRDQYQICTKLCNGDQMSGNIRQSLESSLKTLQVDYVDLYLMHWPVTETFLDSWKQMEELYKSGLCKAIGVCNCNIHHLEEIKKVAEIMPMVNQIECHPLFTQDELRAYCDENNIQVMAYTPTARMDDRLRKTVLPVIAKKYHKTVAQIILRWHTQIGNVPIVNTSNAQHLMDNFNVFDFTLTEEEIKSITAININSRLRYDPDNCDFSQL